MPLLLAGEGFGDTESTEGVVAGKFGAFDERVLTDWTFKVLIVGVHVVEKAKIDG